MGTTPEGIILKSFFDFITFNGKKILEIGCGRGRLTLKFARLAKRVVAIDPDAKDVEKALHKSPKELSPNLSFQIATGEKLPFAAKTFDIVFYSGSLCCMSSARSVEESLYEAWRVLRSDGVLLNLQPTRILFSLDVVTETHQKGEIFDLLAEKSKTIHDCWWRNPTEKMVFTILQRKSK